MNIELNDADLSSGYRYLLHESLDREARARAAVDKIAGQLQAAEAELARLKADPIHTTTGSGNVFKADP